MLYSLTYRRPAYVEGLSGTPTSSTNEELDCRRNSLRSGSSNVCAGIPDALSFDRIVEGGTCPPCTIRDFTDYLRFVERSAENLQFFIWCRDYEKRFKKAKTTDIALAPEWTQQQQDAAVQATRFKPRSSKGDDVVELFKGTDFENRAQVTVSDMKDPFATPPRTPAENPKHPWEHHSTRLSENNSIYTVSNSDSYRQVAREAFNAAGLRQPFTIQPFREEIDRIIAIYFVHGAPRELNISAREKSALLQALQYTTHPSALRPVQKSVEYSLRRQAHPNFVRWTIRNGNGPRVLFARALGVSLILAGFITAILVTLSKAGRGWRVIAAVGWLCGISTLIAAWRGMCVVLHGFHHRHLRPWELFQDSESEVEMKKTSFDSFSSSNSYEDEPWVVKYEKRNCLRKIIDREVWIEEPALRKIQDTIFLQSLLAALIVTIILIAVFVPVPSGKLY
ncbi:MAG: hypothetical protein M1818_002043 [Claussenomyces sp. TS43310]|nr:MAG: hypothetical protein M1818_002043 [Claussenomyces sp. TS43310]